MKSYRVSSASIGDGDYESGVHRFSLLLGIPIVCLSIDSIFDYLVFDIANDY